MDHVQVNEVGLRDGLQMHPKIVPTADKLSLLESLLRAGVDSFEVASFVSPKAVPQMADAAELCVALPPLHGDGGYSVLVPNRKGLERADEAGCRTVNLVLSATETMNQKNIGMSLSKTREVCVDTIHQARRMGLDADAYVAVAFECPYEGRVAPGLVADLATEMFDAGAGRVIIADTVGAANPAQVKRMFSILSSRLDVSRLACHFHDTRALALANVWQSLEAGVRRFDSSIGGLGGCPFSPGASGNLATEDLVLMLHQCGFSTGIDVDRLIEAVSVASAITGRELGGRMLAWWSGSRERGQTRLQEGRV